MAKIEFVVILLLGGLVYVLNFKVDPALETKTKVEIIDTNKINGQEIEDPTPESNAIESSVEPIQKKMKK